MASRGRTELTDKDMRENKDDINTHTNNRIRYRWGEEGKGQVRERTGCHTRAHFQNKAGNKRT